MASSNASSSAMLNAASHLPELSKSQEFINHKDTKTQRHKDTKFVKAILGAFVSWWLIFHPDLRAELLDFAIRTIRLARVAAAAAMPDEPVAEQRPLFLRHELHQLLLDFYRVRLFRQAKAVGKPRDVRIHNDADVDAERVSENDVRRLAPDTGERM